MTKKQEIQLFNDRRIRTIWDDKEEKWYFSVVDVIEALTETDRPRKYWSDLKAKLKKEGSELSEKIGQLKLQSSDGKYYKTDIADQEQLFRLIQSIPSPKAEPFKVWMATVASERLDEMQDPELTDEWKRCGVTTQQYASLTDIISMAWSGKSTRSYKAHKGLKKQNLRDNMTNLELALNTLAEAATTEISKEINPTTYRDNVTVARKGGGVAKVAREQLEQQLGRSVISDSNSSTLRISGDSPDEQ